MPRGIPKQNPDDPTPPQFLRVTLRPEDYAALARLAGESYRTPELQAGYMLAKMLSGTTADTAARIIAHAKANNIGE